ncbi:hypothetical protein MTY66_50690 [Mycolicibacterium sp. TY66]|nr:hypothetical protein MTY66_50690 [Mycolicibacterium sp. TY66]BCJ78912.1 hypothetical protein MTY81_02850 [Mycolicibacterium sp. TY81]
MSALPQSAPTVIELLTKPPVPTDRDGQGALLRAACAEGLPVAIMCPTGAVAADVRPGIDAADRVPVRARRGQFPPELITTDAAVAVGWLRAYAEQVTDPGIAVQVGAEMAAQLDRTPGLLAAPVKGWVTAWRPTMTPPLRAVPPPLLTQAAAPDPAWVREMAEREAAQRERLLQQQQQDRERWQREQRKRELERLAAERWEREKFDAHPRPGDPRGLKPIRIHPDELGDYTPGGGSVVEGYYVVQTAPSMRFYFRVTVAPYGSGKLYARRLNHEMYTGRITTHGRQKLKYPIEQCWEYAVPMSHGQWLDQIRLYGKLMTQEEFERFGALYGVCVRCEQLLTRPESIKVGCGAVCAPHLGVDYPTSPSDQKPV